MAQVILTVCDLCADTPAPGATPDDPRTTAGTPVVLAVGEGAAPRVVDLCPWHYDQTAAPLLRLLDAQGRRLPAPAATSSTPPPVRRGGAHPVGDGYLCLVCAHRVGTSSGLTIHTRAHHNLRSGEELYGTDPALCPLCDYTSAAAFGVAQHAVRNHGIESGPGAIHRLWARAVDEGDPTGAVAKRQAELGAL